MRRIYSIPHILNGWRGFTGRKLVLHHAESFSTRSSTATNTQTGIRALRACPIKQPKKNLYSYSAQTVCGGARARSPQLDRQNNAHPSIHTHVCTDARALRNAANHLRVRDASLMKWLLVRASSPLYRVRKMSAVPQTAHICTCACILVKYLHIIAN